MSNHQKEAGIAEFVKPLLKDLKLAKDRVPENSEIENFIDQINTKVEEVEGTLSDRKKSDREIVRYFEKIQRQIDPWMDHKPRKKSSDLPKDDTRTDGGESSNRNYQMNEDSKFREFMHSLDPLLSRYLNSLLRFPENTELKKRLVINWWISLSWPIIEDYERLFSNLVEKKVLIPVHRKHNKVIDCFTIEPIFRKLLISNSERYGHLYYEEWQEGTSRLYFLRQVLLNLNQRYLNSNDILMEITGDNMEIKPKNELEVVQLGSWCYRKTKEHKGVKETGSEGTKSIDHIEVDQTDFLKKLGKNVKCISLGGISGITEFDESIGKLEFLKILDLRACHNLEKLPQKPGSTLIQTLARWALNKDNVWFGNLIVLDISECYLLDNMPKWVCELSNLEVLKGFVVSSLGNKNQSCWLSDLSKLHKLRKLSIRIVTGMLDPDVFRGFDTLDSLLILTITWGENKYKEIPTYSLPKNLEKLDIRCYPGDDALKLTEELTNLKRLYIRGGNLTKIPFHDNWQVEILRLRFMEKLNCPTDWEEFMRSFKNLKYVEFVNCCKPKNFPNDGDNWRESNYQNDKEVSKFQKLVDSFHSLHPMGSERMKSLIIFPENTVLKKRLVIYWWSVLFGGDTEINERIFSNMVHEEVFIPIHREHNKVINRVTIQPLLYKWLISNSERYFNSERYSRGYFEGALLTGTWHLLYGEPRDKYFTILLNVDQRYLSSQDIMGIIQKNDDLQLVQLGSWCCTETEVHNKVEEIGYEECIEVYQTNFLNKLGKHVKYLSLRGISGIAELPESIGKLEYLEILDLRACHDLIKLPQKPRSRFIQKLTRSDLQQDTLWFNRLTVLDISECYLLDNMPKWICGLSNLEVIKGFVVGVLGNQYCQLGDILKLNKLRKLSIRIAIDNLEVESGAKVFRGFHDLDSLLVLTITWEQNSYKEIPTYSLPKNLEKLDMRCYPEADASKWENPEELKNLKRLYIRGGNLTKIPCHENWKVEILRLRFLEKLVNPTDLEEFRRGFSSLKHVECVECPGLKIFPKVGISRSNEKDEVSQKKSKLLKASIAEIRGPLLKRLELAKERVSENREMGKIIDIIRIEVEKTRDSLDSIHRDRVLISLFGEIERKINARIDHNKRWDKMNESTLTTELNDILGKLSQISTPDLPQKGKTIEVTESSHRSYQKEAKLLKASIAEFMGPLLKSLALAKRIVSENREIGEIIDKIRGEVVKAKDILDGIQNRDRVLIGLFGKIERQIDPWIDHIEKRAEMNERAVMTELEDILCMLSQIPTERTPLRLREAKPTEVAESSNRSYQEDKWSKAFIDLEELDVCSVLNDKDGSSWRHEE